MIYTRYMLTTGVDFFGEFIPKASQDDAMEVIDREGEGRTAYALMGFDPESGMWEILVVRSSHHDLVRCVRMMLRIGLKWDGDVPMEFDRA